MEESLFWLLFTLLIYFFFVTVFECEFLYLKTENFGEGTVLLIYFQLTRIFGNILFSLPRKISSIQWLMIAGALPIGNRRTLHGWEGLCVRPK